MRKITVLAFGATTAGLLAAGGSSSAHAAVGHTANTAFTSTHMQTAFTTSQSSNWSGYNQGTLEKGTTFHEVSGTWVVPAAHQRVSGQTEYSATWVGIGGGCLDTSCSSTDQTLIQAGTEQDVNSKGVASYGAWWEIIPQPSTPIALPVAAGQRVHVDVAETATREVWSIVIKNLSTGRSFSTTVSYSSSYATAEWIVETPLVIGSGGTGVAALPNLGKVVIDPGTANKANPALTAAEEIQLIDSRGHVIATPSAPDRERDGFGDCTYATSCATPAS